MLTPAAADAAIESALGRLPSESAPLAACAGRVLRACVRAERDAPPFDRVTMDGIAIAADPARREFRIAGLAPAGAPQARSAASGECLEVMTGAVLPAGCDTVVPVERIRVAADRAALEPGYEPLRGQFVHRRAADAKAGDVLLEPGVRLDGPALALAASAGCAELEVSRRPRVAVVSTGDELVEPGKPILPHQVRRSNAYGLAAALARTGHRASSDRHVPDDPDRIAAVVGELLESHDVLVLSGGVSAGRFDHVPAALAARGVQRLLHGVSQRPGRPLWVGASPGRVVFGLPGNPVSVLVCFVRYVRPALGRLEGANGSPPAMSVLARDIPFDAPLTCFLPVRLRYDGQGRAIAEPRPTGGSGDLVALAGSDGFVELPRGPARHPAGLVVPFHPW